MSRADSRFIYETYLNPAGTTTSAPSGSAEPQQPSQSSQPNQPAPATNTPAPSTNPAIDKLKAMGHDVQEVNATGIGKQLQITLKNDKGPSKGVTMFLPSNTPEDVIVKAIEQKRRQFQQ